MTFLQTFDMKKLIYLLCIITIASCNDSDEILGPATNVNLNINATFNGEPFEIGKAYTYPDGHKIKFDEFSFFIAGVTLLESETDDELDLLEVGLADFAASTGQAQPASFLIRTVPAVKYDAIRLSIGVPSKFNKPSILDYGAGHPVRSAYDTHFWDAGESFYFMKLGGVYDTNGDGVFGSSPEDDMFQHYPVKNANFITLTLQKELDIVEGKPFDLDLSVDILKLYEDEQTNTPLDFTKPENLSTIDPENDALSAFLMKNFQQALTAE